MCGECISHVKNWNLWTEIWTDIVNSLIFLILLNFIIFIDITTNFRTVQENEFDFFAFLNLVMSDPSINVWYTVFVYISSRCLIICKRNFWVTLIQYLPYCLNTIRQWFKQVDTAEYLVFPGTCTGSHYSEVCLLWTNIIAALLEYR